MGRESALRVVSLCVVLTFFGAAISQAQVVGGLSVPGLSSLSTFTTLGNFRSYSAGVSSGNYSRNQNAASVMNGRSNSSGRVSSYSGQQRLGYRVNNRISANQGRSMITRGAPSHSNIFGPQTRITELRPIGTRYSSFSRNPGQLSTPTTSTTSGFTGSYVSRNVSAFSHNPFESRQSVMTRGSGLSNLQSISNQPSWFARRR